MPPLLALFLCTVFVLYLLRLDRRESADAPPSHWLPTLFMLYASSKPLADWFGKGGVSIESGSSLDRNFLIVLIALALWALARRGCDWRGLLGRQPWLVALLGYMLVSTIWSDIPFISLKRWMREFLAVLVALLIASESDPRHALATILKRVTYILIPYSLMLIKYFPVLGVEHGRWSGKQMWIGVTQQKNALGWLCLVSAFFIIWTLVGRWRGMERPVSKAKTRADLFVLALSLWLLKGPEDAYSATSVAVLAAGLGMFGILSWLHGRGVFPGAFPVAFAIVLLIAWGIATPILGGSSFATFSTAIGRDSTLTGRTEIWEGLLPLAYKHPILGCGFGGFWTSEMAEIHQENSAHNGYLDAQLQLGFAGLFLIAGYLIASGFQARRLLALDFAFGSFWLCCLAMMLLHNITESSIDTFTRQLTAFLMFLSVSSPALMNGPESQTERLDDPDYSPSNHTHAF